MINVQVSHGQYAVIGTRAPVGPLLTMGIERCWDQLMMNVQLSHGQYAVIQTMVPVGPLLTK